MKDERLVSTTVNVIVGIIIIASFMGLFITYGEGEDKSMVNVGLNVDPIADDETYTISMDSSGAIEINGEASTIDKVYWLSDTINVFGENGKITLRFYVSEVFSLNEYVAGTDTFELTASEGSIEITANDTTVTTAGAYEWAYIYDESGKYVYNTTSTPAYINTVDNITMYSAGERYLYHEGTLYFLGAVAEGTPVYNWNLTDTNVDSVKILGTSIAGIGSDSRQMTLYIVPIEATYHIDGALEDYGSLVLIIPPLLILALLMMCVRELYTTKND